MNTISAHVFQHNYTGIQIFIFHTDSGRVFEKLHKSGINSNDYTYLGTKQVVM